MAIWQKKLKLCKINNVEWRIHIVSPLYYKLKQNNNYAIGACDTYNKNIYISNNLSKEEFEKVLYHEITHAALDSYNIKLDNKEKEIISNLTFEIKNIIKKVGN